MPNPRHALVIAATNSEPRSRGALPTRSPSAPAGTGPDAVAALKAENEALRAENTALRSALAEARAILAPG